MFSEAERLCLKVVGITDFKAGMCLSEFSWYLPWSSYQHLYIEHCSRTETSQSVYLCMRRAGQSHSSFYILVNHIWFGIYTETEKLLTVIFPSLSQTQESDFVFTLFRHNLKYLSLSCTYRHVPYNTLQTHTFTYNQTINRKYFCTELAGMSSSEWERFTEYVWTFSTSITLSETW